MSKYLSVRRPEHHRASGREGRVLTHLLIAERALGRPLPNGAEVHHVDENRKNNAPPNLVICQDRDYHQFLHVRTRVVRAGGDPNTQRICGQCEALKPFAAFSKAKADKATGLQGTCRQCSSAISAKRYERLVSCSL